MKVSIEQSNELFVNPFLTCDTPIGDFSGGEPKRDFVLSRVRSIGSVDDISIFVF